MHCLKSAKTQVVQAIVVFSNRELLLYILYKNIRYAGKYSSSSIIRMAKSRTMRWAGYVCSTNVWEEECI
jgi:hypothetical protein